MLKNLSLYLITYIALISYGWADLLIGYVPAVTADDRKLSVECGNLKEPVVLTLRASSGSVIASYTLTKDTSEIQIIDVGSDAFTIFAQRKDTATCRYKVYRNAQLTSVIPLQPVNKGLNRHIPPANAGNGTFRVVIVNASEISHEICANSECAIMEAFSTRITVANYEAPVTIKTQTLNVEYVSSGIMEEQGETTGILIPAQECDGRCTFALLDIDGATSSFDLLPLRKSVVIQIWNSAGVPIENETVFEENGIVRRSYHNEGGRALRVECPTDTPITPCASIQAYYSTKNTIVSPQDFTLSSGVTSRARSIYPLKSSNLSVNLVLSPLAMFKTNESEVDLDSYRIWGNAIVSSIHGIEIQSGLSIKEPVLVPVSYYLEYDNKKDYSVEPTKKTFVKENIDCQEEARQLINSAPLLVRSQLSVASELIKEAARLEFAGNVEKAYQKYEAALSIVPIMQCARTRLLTLSNAFSSPSLDLLSSEMREHKVLSRDGYLSVIWHTLQTGDSKTARDLMEELKVRYQDESAPLLYMKALLDSFDGNESNIKDYLERAHQLSPTLVLPLVALSRVHRIAGNVTKADDLVQKAIVAAQENLLNLDRLKEDASPLWVTLPERYLHLGIALYEAGYKDRTMLVSSREALAAALTLEPGLPSADVYFTSVLIDLHEEESALHYSNVRGAKSLYQAWLMLQRSRAYYYSDRTDEAQAELDQAREWHLPMEWQEWFKSVILGANSSSPRSSSSYFPFSANSVIPPQLVQFDRESPFSREKFSEFVAASFDSDRNVRHEAAFKVGTYFTKSSEDALHLFFAKFRSEVTEDYLSAIGWEGASFLLQFAPELEREEMARTRDLLLSDEMKKQRVALFMITTHGAQCAQLLPSLKSYVQVASSRTPLSSLIKALGAIHTLGSEELLMELGRMKQFVTAKGEIVEVLKYGTLSNSSIDSYFKSLIVTEDFGKMTAIERKAYVALSYRKLRRQMPKAVNYASTNELKSEDY